MILLLTSILSSKLLEFIFLNLLGETSGTFGSIVGFILPYSIALEFILKKLFFNQSIKK
ncbi:hypothetical protein K144316041_p10670 (plasmid) [Clostridium tetani]|uniref:Uncharacterized protein n=1 Tax=Clostridium tetani TaxID=1513 RepID=A0ABC8EGD5_CLOTA|nr:hypothetical protein [Clostridium tetani]CDI50882.1 hypothetical protein BN906_02933 [Clostridium tetani 12124569]BDR68564.1 hypothetical protein K144312032_p10540 [Clostridium tetani]BDR74139.1 hypothetical protein K144316041_p10670 [Clostridium tetani]BDR82495.1 hypothetical protein K234311028_p10540 [Clostridium tetani]BDR90885.1 hypothetical protein N072000002_p10540 [Clostridium tetani]